MDQLEAFLSGQPIVRKVISGGSTNGRIRTEYEEPNYGEDVVPERTTKYAKKFVDKVKQEVWKRFDRTCDTDKRETSDIYDRYNFTKRLQTSRLPIEDHEDNILDTIQHNNVVILRGPTGCGKTTKVPQFILDEYRRKNLYCTIVVAQPRRIAASSNARRVCKERGWICGSIVGYQVGSDQRKNRSDDTRILFCTTGVLVESIINNAAYNPLDKFTHIILDEVHERDKDMDFLMIAIYKYLNPKIRIILMSATIDVNKFARYYQIPQNMTEGKAPIIELGFTRNFDVTTIFLDQIEDIMFEERMNLPEINEQMYQVALKLVVFFERIDRKHALAAGIDLETYNKQPKPTVLIFLPGIYEIRQMYQRLEDWCLVNDETHVLRLIMHSTADPLINDLVMQESNRNIRKIILATNIAESSITVPDVKYVIDFCLTRHLVVNPLTNFPTLQLAWASRDNCEQRAGRSGRVMNGWCFRLVSRRFYYDEMRQSAKAEMMTSPLENIILKTKSLNLGSPEEVLALALDKPYLDDIHKTVLRLKEMGAMLLTTGGKVKPRDGDITYIGEIMSSMPIDVKLSKLIALGYCFGVMGECIIIAAALNCSKNFFVSSKLIGVKAYSKLLEFADGSGSDLFALLNAYRTWKKLRTQGKFGDIENKREQKAVRKAEKEWADENFLEIASLRECDECIKELRFRIKRMNLIDCSKLNVSWNRNEKYIVLKVVIAGAFYPNYFSRSTKSKRGEEVQNFKTIGGRDCSNTVYFTGFKSNDFPHIYLKRIKDILVQNHVISERDAHMVTVSPDNLAEKIYVIFKKSGKEGDIRNYGVACQPGFVLTEVYKAIKLRYLKLENRIQILRDRNTALSYARDHELIYDRDDKIHLKSEIEYVNVCYPRKLEKEIKGYITHTENCGRFWFQPSKYLKKINDIYKELNNPNSDLEPFEYEMDIKIGEIVAAEFPSGSRQTEYYRAKVISIQPKTETKQTNFEVQYIDFGNTRNCGLNELRRLRGVSSSYISLPPYCFPCSLAFIQPPQIICPDGVWTNERNQKFVAKTDGSELKAEIFSVVNGIVRVVRLFTINSETNEIIENICQSLITERIADHCEESYMSKHDHIEREIGRNEQHATNHLTHGIIRHLQEEDIPVIEPPTMNNGRMDTVRIKGPYSPLEIILYGLSNNSSGSPKIDPLSVNHVLLENEPNDMSEKYLIAVSANSNDEKSTLTVRQTTLMPNIRLFAPLMAAIFAPKIKLQRNKMKTHYVRMLSGLGCDDHGVCLSPDTNMKFDLDVELKNTDIETVNSIRKNIDRLLSPNCFKLPIEEKLKIMQNLQNELISLFSLKRLLIPEEYGDVSWGPYKSEDVSFSPEHSSRRIFPPHEYLYLKNPDISYLVAMEEHHKQLFDERLTVSDDPKARTPKCKICNIDVEEGIRLHLLSRQHKDGYQAIQNALKAIK